MGVGALSLYGADRTDAVCGEAVGSSALPGTMLNDNPASSGALGVSDIIRFEGHGGLSAKATPKAFLNIR